MVGYPTDSVEVIKGDGDEVVLMDKDYYGLGTTRPREAYLELTMIDPVQQKCGHMKWCLKGELE